MIDWLHRYTHASLGNTALKMACQIPFVTDLGKTVETLGSHVNMTEHDLKKTQILKSNEKFISWSFRRCNDGKRNAIIVKERIFQGTFCYRFTIIVMDGDFLHFPYCNIISPFITIANLLQNVLCLPLPSTISEQYFILDWIIIHTDSIFYHSIGWLSPIQCHCLGEFSQTGSSRSGTISMNAALLGNHKTK